HPLDRVPSEKALQKEKAHFREKCHWNCHPRLDRGTRKKNVAQNPEGFCDRHVRGTISTISATKIVGRLGPGGIITIRYARAG
ncbi:MAG: hypothetical protein NTV06_09575, partial [candidate division Zixibacteria bacterium]|nr:hypothetical protein [candidate division Zixibacteria bacterium]